VIKIVSVYRNGQQDWNVHLSSEMTYLDKVSRVAIIINAAGVEARSSALCAQARY
jgi:hypothetical protein